jgi:hypothetical protein
MIHLSQKVNSLFLKLNIFHNFTTLTIALSKKKKITCKKEATLKKKQYDFHFALDQRATSVDTLEGENLSHFSWLISPGPSNDYQIQFGFTQVCTF